MQSKARLIRYIELFILVLIPLGLGSLLYNAEDPESTHAADAAHVAGQISALERQIQTFRAKGRLYVQRAPREYDAYFRDTVIVAPQFELDLDHLGTAFDQLVTSALETLDAERVATLRDNWQSFRGGLDEEMGVDPDMPRLEWGAGHIADNLDPIADRLGALRADLHNASHQTVQGDPAWPLAALLAWVAAMLAWVLLRGPGRP